MTLLPLTHLNEYTMNEELPESEERFQMVLEAAEVFIWEWDVPRNRFVVSSNANRLLGCVPASYEALLQWVHAEDRFWVQERLAHALATREECVLEFRVVMPEEAVHWVRQKVRVAGAERPLRMIGAVLDITD